MRPRLKQQASLSTRRGEIGERRRTHASISSTMPKRARTGGGGERDNGWQSGKNHGKVTRNQTSAPGHLGVSTPAKATLCVSRHIAPERLLETLKSTRMTSETKRALLLLVGVEVDRGKRDKREPLHTHAQVSC